jgi:glycosyltransferase involved in cell wall biosynthesis
MVISGKYPAWMSKHHNHKIYMLHTLRGLYDLYGSEDFNQETEDFFKNIDSPDTLFKKIFQMKKNGIKVDFPSYFAKKVIHYLDNKAMENIKEFSAISKTVANRKDYFHSNRNIKVVYPPTNLNPLTSYGYKYFFTVSRLDKPKRIDLIIKAYKLTNTDIPLKIAGEGAEYNYLKELAGNDKRIEFLGFVSDDELKNYYAYAYAIIYIPYQEDYGLVTIEAMQSKKAVITTNDSGGVLEFVKDNQTGLISSPNTKDLSNAITLLSNDILLTKKLGQNAYNLVKNINWFNTTKELLNLFPKLTVITTYPVYPPRGGGQNRVYYLYKELAKFYKITIIAIVHNSLPYTKKQIAPNLYEIQIPKSLYHEEKEQKLAQKLKIPITDIALLYYYNLTPAFIDTIKKESKDTNFVIATNPYVYPLLKKHISKPIIYESQNVEYLLKKDMLEKTSLSKKLLNKLFQVEKEFYLNSFLTTTCSKDDAISFEKIYGKKAKKLPFIPNGVDLESTPYFWHKRKLHYKKYYGYQDKKVAIFMGSAHKPNIDATYKIIQLAQKEPNINFIIIGGLYYFFQDKNLPSNIHFTGIIDNKEKAKYLAIADIALNPMLTGSGTNLKMLDYLASGVPTISTQIGARGLNIPKGAILIAPIKDWHKYLYNLSYYVDTKRAKEFVQKHYSWKVIAKKLQKVLSK